LRFKDSQNDNRITRCQADIFWGNLEQQRRTMTRSFTLDEVILNLPVPALLFEIMFYIAFLRYAF